VARAPGRLLEREHDRKREFHRLMLEECLAYEARGWKVCLIGDMNVARGPLDGFRGVDLWRHLYGERRGYTYYGRGVEWGSSCDRVDLCVVSKRCVEGERAFVGIGILETKEGRGHSDHVPLWVEFDLKRLK
jgi:exonuclease III